MRSHVLASLQLLFVVLAMGVIKLQVLAEECCVTPVKPDPWKPYPADGDPETSETVTWAHAWPGCTGKFYRGKGYYDARDYWTATCAGLSSKATAFFRNDTEADAQKPGMTSWVKLDC